MTTENITDEVFEVGEIVYAKKNPMILHTLFFKKNTPADNQHIGIYEKTIREGKEVVDKFDMPLSKRKAYMIRRKTGSQYELTYLYQEDDIINPEDKYRRYKELIYYEEDGRVIISGIETKEKKVFIPREIKGKEVLAIGNTDENGLFVPVELKCEKRIEIIVYKGLKEIYPNAFMNKNLKRIKLPETLYYIGEKAFYGCNIPYINLEFTQIDEIQKQTFFACTLKKIKLPRMLKIIKEKAFKNSHLHSVEFNSDIDYVGKEAFYDCDIDTNRTNIGFVDKNAFTNGTPCIHMECENINYDDVKFKIIGRIEGDDIIKDETLFENGIEQQTRCKKHIFFAQNEEEKYEIVIEQDEEFGNDDLYLEYLKYINSVRINLYKVSDFDLNRHFEKFEANIGSAILTRTKDDCKIDIRYIDGKILDIELDTNYRYNYNEFIYNLYNLGDFFETNEELTSDILLNKSIGVDDTNEKYIKYKKCKEKYLNFLARLKEPQKD